MNFKPLSTITAALLITTFTSIDLSSAAGRSTTAIVNTILNGKGTPKNSLGIDGDFYIDTRSLLLFGPKTKGKWPTPQSIQGPTGPSGNDGKNGSDGKAISSNNVNNIAGPVGPQGPMGATGAPGPQGEKGETGAAGTAGSSGANGSNGASGPQGPAGATGPQGPAGATGPQGPIGLTGATGAKGETGTVGPRGPSGPINVTYGDLSFNDLSGGAGTGESVQITNFEAARSYLVRIKIYCFQPNDSTEYFLPLSLAITSSINGVVAQFSYTLQHGYSFRSGANRYENSIDAEVILDGKAAISNFGITLLVTSGRNTGGSELTRIAGEFTAMQVESAQNYA